MSLVFGLVSVGLLLALAGGQPANAAAPQRPHTDIVVTTTIQAAIDGAPTNATVFVPAGTYTESLTLNKAVNLTGALSSTTIVRALAGQRVLTVTGISIHNSTIISGLTFTGGNVSGDGGGIRVDTNAQPLLENLIISGNQASNTGGGLFTDLGSPLELVNVVIYSNTAVLYGGGIFASDDLNLLGSRIENNRCTDVSCRGGGLTMNDVLPLTMAATQFIHNQAGSVGGGAYTPGPVDAQDSLFQGNTCSGCSGGGLSVSGALALTRTNFISNTSVSDGGGVRAGAEVTVLDGLFQGNSCTAPDCLGGGLESSGALAVNGTRFISNTASGLAGGGVVAGGPTTLQGVLFQGNATLTTSSLYGGGGLFAFDTLAVTATQFVGNRTQGGGGALWVEAGGGRVVNSLFAGNAAGNGGAAVSMNAPGALVLLHATIVSPAVAGGSAIAVLSGSVGITNSLIASYTVGINRTAGTVREDYNLFSGVAVSGTGSLTHGGHSLTGVAAFRNPAAGDFHLGLGSAAINAGTNAGVTTDFDGDPRPTGAAPDVGFDEARLVTLVLSKSDGQSSVQSGAGLTYTILINNTGPFTASSVLVSDSLPASLTNAGWTCLASAGSSCPASGSGSISATVTIAGGSFVQFTLHATVSPSANGTIVNTVSVTLPAGLVNTNSANESASDSTTIMGGPPIKLYLPLTVR